ncbi:tail fiber domain-containing protein [Luteirhabdus pelagi]|uniref:tail fiber domain-containing protein n=1 Tax=Luteirhabdus pelagi TaxID=2792783 RepID=UPI00193ABB73|nr:tail fiber domain-containing protein [Luteirhabdus pelagi]
MKKAILLQGIILSLLFFEAPVFAQVGINTTTPSPGSLLDVQSSEKGVFIPKVDITDLSTIAPITGISPINLPNADGLMVYNTNTTTGPGFFFWNGSGWITIDGDKNWSKRGNSGTLPGTAAGQDYFGTSDLQDLIFGTNGSEAMRIASTGNMGINAPSTLSRLEISEGSALQGSIYSHITNTASNWSAVEGYNANISGGAGMYGIGFTGIVADGATGISGYGFVGVEGIPVDPIIDWAGYFFGDIGINNDSYATNYFIWSDSRIKSNISPFINAISLVNQLTPVTYDKAFSVTKNDSGVSNLSKIESQPLRDNSSQKYDSNSIAEIGFLAQDVQKVFPQLVHKRKINLANSDIEELLSVNYIGLIPVLTKAIQEQQTEIEDLKQRLQTLEVMVLSGKD